MYAYLLDATADLLKIHMLVLQHGPLQEHKQSLSEGDKQSVVDQIQHKYVCPKVKYSNQPCTSKK